jgi:hypothetical protein
MDLVIEAIGHPPAQLFRGGAARIQQNVEGVVVVVTVGIGPQLALKLRGVEGLRRIRIGVDGVDQDARASAGLSAQALPYQGLMIFMIFGCQGSGKG